MHLDQQINNYEARSLLRKSMDMLIKIANEYNASIIVITSSKAYSQRHSNLLTLVQNRCQTTLLGKFGRLMAGKRCSFSFSKPLFWISPREEKSRDIV